MLLNKFIHTYGNFSESEVGSFASHFQSLKINKGKQILKPGEVCSNLYFVKTGCLRLYYLSGGVDTSLWFSFENNSSIELSSFISNEPTQYFIEAVEDSELLSISKKEIETLKKELPFLDEFLGKYWEDVILNLLKRFTTLQMDSAEKRYLDLMQNTDYLQRIPQKYLASYIGITPTSLSRIRRNIKAKLS